MRLRMPCPDCRDLPAGTVGADDALETIDRYWLEQYVVRKTGRDRHIHGAATVSKRLGIGKGQGRRGDLIVAADQHPDPGRRSDAVNQRDRRQRTYRTFPDRAAL